MTILYIILYASIVAWLCPPFRQYKGNYFFYFLILALSDSVGLILMKLFGVYGQYVHSISAYLIVLSLIYFPKNNRPKIILVIPVTIIFIAGYAYLENIMYLIIIFHILVLIVFAKRALVVVFENKVINLFNWVLLFYEISLVINLSLSIEGNYTKYIIFYATLFFQIFVAIFFTIFTEKSPSLIFKLKYLE